jgi:hypothetical protein
MIKIFFLIILKFLKNLIYIRHLAIYSHIKELFKTTKNIYNFYKCLKNDKIFHVYK